MSIRDPNWIYYTAAETQQAGYLRRRMQEYARQQALQIKGFPHPVEPLLPLPEPLLSGLGVSHKDPHRSESVCSQTQLSLL